MELLIYILVFNFIGSIVSLIGGILLLIKGVSYKTTHYLSSFAAGTLLGTVFFDLLPEALSVSTKKVGSDQVFFYILLGILFFFLLERALHWFHSHGHDDLDKGKPIIPMIILGDTLHNFVDGIAIAATFSVSIPAGIITSFAVSTHEIPQEIGDFGIMLKNKIAKMNVLNINLISALASFVGAILAFYFGSKIEGLSVIMLSLTSGFFLYIALSDLIPEIHHQNRKNMAGVETLMLIVGVLSSYLVLYFITNVLHLTA